MKKSKPPMKQMVPAQSALPDGTLPGLADLNACIAQPNCVSPCPMTYVQHSLP